MSSNAERYLIRKERCTDITTKIFPHCKDMYSRGVKEMTALDSELSAAPLTVKTRWCVKNIEGLLKLQSRIASSATGGTLPVYRQAMYRLSLKMQCETLNIPHDSHVRVPRSSHKNPSETVLLVSDGIVVVSARNYRIVGFLVYRWSCIFFPGNIASNANSRSSGRSGWFIGSQLLSYPSRIGTSPCT